MAADAGTDPIAGAGQAGRLPPAQLPPASREVSVVVPVFNEAENLPALNARLLAVMDGLGRSFEVIYTNDGSADASGEILRGMVAARPDVVRAIDFERNYGQHMAIMAAFEFSRGAVVVTIDADLQNPPEEIPKLLALTDAGHDAVGGYRALRQDSRFRRWASWTINRVRAASTSIAMRDQGCMLRAYARPVVERIVASGETSTFIPALGQYFAARPAEVEVAHAARAAGESKYNLYKLIRLNFDLMTGFSLLPLQVFTMFGMAVSGASLLLVIYLALRRIFIGPEAEGLFTLFGILFFLVGVVITGLGIVGEYVGRIYVEVRRRPRYSIRALHEGGAQDRAAASDARADAEDRPS
ncbi:MAG: glycosyltransferase [Sneathiellaceae bacterium]